MKMCFFELKYYQYLQLFCLADFIISFIKIFLVILNEKPIFIVISVHTHLYVLTPA